MTAIGIDLGGTNIKAIAVEADGKALTQTNLGFEAETQMDWANKIRGLLRDIQSRPPSTNVAGESLLLSDAPVGVSAPGLPSSDQRSISHMPSRLGGLEGLNWTEFLGVRHPVPVLNDAHAALLGECWKGAAQGFQNVIMLTLGTGVGGAAMGDGKLLRGHLGRAGHWGHICLNPQGTPDVTGAHGSLEIAIGNCTVRTRSHGRFDSTHDLVAAYRAGDREARLIWLKSVRELACAIISFINILDP